MNKKLITSVFSLFVLSLPACSGGNGRIVDNSGFKNINENEEFEIHTDQQKAFLEYEGSYANMPDNLFPDGQEHLSDSKPITLTWNYESKDGSVPCKYTVIYGQEPDLSDGYKVSNDASEDSITFNNPYLGTNYYKLIATFTDDSEDESLTRHFEVKSSYPRNLTIEGMTNCRDMGGRVLENGKRIKQGLVFRTSGKNQNGSLTDATTEEMVNHLKVKNEINLAGDSNSYNLQLAGTTLIESCKMDTSSTGGANANHLSRNAEAVKNFFNILADSNNYPLFYHCKIGTDRTGLCSVLLSGLLGVSLNEIYQDYLFSNFGKIGEKRGIGTGDSHDMLKYIDDLLKYSGATFQEKVYNVLLSIGVSEENLEAVMSNLIEDNDSLDAVERVVAPAKELVASGINMSTDTSDRNNPNEYYVLNSDSQSLSYTFNAKKAYTGQVVAYLGNDSNSETKKIADAVSCQLDNDNINMLDQTYYNARMGKCTVSGTSRTNYFPVILGTVSIEPGEHTIKIIGSSNAMNIGGLYIFDNATAGGDNQRV